jgi:hypothetical protein
MALAGLTRATSPNFLMVPGLSPLIRALAHIGRLIRVSVAGQLRVNFSLNCRVSALAHETFLPCSLSFSWPVYYHFKESFMSLGTLLLIVLILMLIGAIPSWSHSRNWGYGPSGGLGLVVIIIVVLLLMGRI